MLKVGYKIKYLLPLIFLSQSLLATEYNCLLDTVKYLKSNKFVILKKPNQPKVKMNFFNNKVYIKVGDNIEYTLNYIEEQNFYNIKKIQIYEKNGVQLEIIDISNSWSTGARLFHKNRMLMIGTCKKQ